MMGFINSAVLQISSSQIRNSFVCSEPVRSSVFRTAMKSFSVQRPSQPATRMCEENFEYSNNTEDTPPEDSKLFVGNLSWGLTSETLAEAFDAFGEVTYARVVTDRETGRSKGFGFVEFSSASSAKDAMEKMNGQELEGRPIRVDKANQQRRTMRGVMY